MEQKSMMVFPYNQDSVSIIENRNKIVSYELKVVCSFKEDSNIIYQNVNIAGVTVTVDFEAALDKIQVILFCDNILKVDPKGYNSKIEIALKNKKKIMMSKSLFDELSKTSDILLEKTLDIEILQNKYVKELVKNKRTLYPIKTPIISIFGFDSNCDKFNTHIALADRIESKGYKCLNVFANSLGKVLGGEILPDFMYSDMLSFDKKVKLFNFFIYELEKSYSPDIIVISSSFGIMPKNIYLDNRFGELLLVISNALELDAGILCIDFIEEVSAYYYEEWKKMMKYKFSIPLSAICISNIKKKFKFDEREQECYFLNERHINKLTLNIYGKEDIYFAFDKKNQNRCLDKIIQGLENNIKVF